MQDTGCERTSCKQPTIKSQNAEGRVESKKKVSSSCNIEILSEIPARAAQRNSSSETPQLRLTGWNLALLKQLDPHVHSYWASIYVARFDENPLTFEFFKKTKKTNKKTLLYWSFCMHLILLGVAVGSGRKTTEITQDKSCAGHTKCPQTVSLLEGFRLKEEKRKQRRSECCYIFYTFIENLLHL